MKPLVAFSSSVLLLFLLSDWKVQDLWFNAIYVCTVAQNRQMLWVYWEPFAFSCYSSSLICTPPFDLYVLPNVIKAQRRRRQQAHLDQTVRLQTQNHGGLGSSLKDNTVIHPIQSHPVAGNTYREPNVYYSLSENRPWQKHPSLLFQYYF